MTCTIHHEVLYRTKWYTYNFKETDIFPEGPYTSCVAQDEDDASDDEEDNR